MFERGSKLLVIDFMAFVSCSSLTIIFMPSSVEMINDCRLATCTALKTVGILPDSHLVRLGNTVFRGCSVLSSFVIPASVEYIGENCFAECYALKTLRFATPSRVRTLLALPPRCRGHLTIPDSVERLCVGNLRGASECVLEFNAESRLDTIDPLPRTKLSDCFLRISSLGLKRIRAQLEFPPGQPN
jgi:hypothetical protein